MRTQYWSVTLVLLAFGLLGTAPEAQAQQGDFAAAPLNWEGFNDAIQEAGQGQKKVLVDVYAPWCGFCRKMHEETYIDDAIKSYLDEHFHVTRVNIEVDDDTLNYRGGYRLSSRMLATIFGTNGTPNTAFLDPEGNFITALPGFAPPEQFLNVLKYIATDAYKRQGFAEFVEGS